MEERAIFFHNYSLLLQKIEGVFAREYIFSKEFLYVQHTFSKEFIKMSYYSIAHLG
jgi:hypothetical protein